MNDLKEAFAVFVLIIGLLWIGTRYAESAGYFSPEACVMHRMAANVILSTKPEARSSLPDAIAAMHQAGDITGELYLAMLQMFNLYEQAGSPAEFERMLNDACPVTLEIGV